MAPATSMSRGARQLVIAVALAVVLLVTVLAIGRRDYLLDPPTLTRLDPASVTRIELDIPTIAAQDFERRPDGWWRTKPSAARADDARLQRLARLAATPVARWIAGTQVTLAKVGLAHPSATLVVNGTRMDYGGLTAIGDLRYVRVAGKVALVPRQYSPEVILTKAGAQP